MSLKTNNLLQKKITAQEQDKVFLYPNSSEYQGDDLGEEVRPSSGHLSSHSPSQGVKTAHLTSSKRKLDDENDLNVGNEIIDQIVTEKESFQGNGPPILENLASAVKLRLGMNKKLKN